MARRTIKNIFFVDDEPGVRKAVRLVVERDGHRVRCFENAVKCLSVLRTAECDMLITDVNMPEMDGVELLRHVKRIRPGLAVLVVSGYGDIPLAVRAVKAGAFDFMEKPLDGERLLAAIRSLSQRSAEENMVGRALTKTENRVLRHLLKGMSNSEIAHRFHRSIRTIEDHRSNIMKKLGVDNVVDLVKTAVQMDLSEEG